MFLHHSKRELRNNCRLYLCVGVGYILSGLLMMQTLPIYTLIITIPGFVHFYLAARAFIAYQEYEDRHTK